MTQISLQDDGTALVGGWASVQNRRGVPYLTRIDWRTGAVDPDWVDPRFSSLAIQSGRIDAIAVSEIDGEPRIWVGGQFHRVGGEVHRSLARLNADGTLDEDFNMGLGLRVRSGSAEVTSIISLSDGDGIVVGGRFDTVDGNEVNQVVKLHNDGRLDPDFGKDLAHVNQLRKIQQDSKGGVLILATFQDNHSEIVRLNPGGTIDGSFVSFSSRASNLSFEILPNDELLVFGSPGFIPGLPGSSIVRLDSSGRLDTEFLPVVQMSGSIRQVMPFQGKDLLLFGNFQEINHLTSVRVAKVSLEADRDASAFLFSDLHYPRILSEGDLGRSIMIPIKRFGSTKDAATVMIDIVGGDARFGGDYTLSERSLVFNPGELEKAVTLRVIDDGLLEPRERVELMLRAPGSGGAFSGA